MTDRPQRLVFGTIAEAYDAHRPHYPDALFDHLLGRVGDAPRALDIGCGTGRVAVALAARGVAGVGVEPDADMAAVARRALRGADWSVQVSDFETCDAPDASVDLITCGQAWHWVDPDAGMARALALLRPGGVLALFWNRPEWAPDDPVRAATDAVYARLVPDMASSIGGKGKPPKGRPLSDDPPPEGFAGAEIVEHRHTVRYTSAAWLDLLGTHSDHVLLDDERRTELHRAVGAAIDDHGGAMDVSYRCEAWIGCRA